MEQNQEVEFRQKSESHHHPHPEPDVEIHVNEKPVIVIGHRHTGLEIKKAAIKQGVKIDLGFLLYLLRPHKPNQLIGDDETITVTRESQFHAIADDDNS
jgi:hypothetical protein